MESSENFWQAFKQFGLYSLEESLRRKPWCRRIERHNTLNGTTGHPEWTSALSASNGIHIVEDVRHNIELDSSCYV
ncbi:hypothetical protein AB1N83_001998 [Pleurotus pulmonarius]